MRRYGMMLAILLLVAVNAFVLACIAYNRSGESLAALTQTEREIPLASYWSYRVRENTGLSLRLDWTTNWFMSEIFYNPADFRRSDEIAWFDQAKLESIGFDCSLPLNAPDAYEGHMNRKREPAYEVTLPVGKRHEPWIAAIREIAPR